MWFLLLGLAFADDETCEVGREGPVGDNVFAAANPGYKQRAGTFYEETYVGPATEHLAEALALGPADAVVARCALTTFVYGWLDAYVREGGVMPEPRRSALAADLDRRLAPLAGDATAREKLARWRASNALTFLLAAAPDPLPPSRE